MSKTIVCIVEEDMTMNYLFIKEMFASGDRILLISQAMERQRAIRFAALFPNVKGHITVLSLDRDSDEDLWDVICSKIRGYVDCGASYVVNLSGGTRLMSIAVQQVFERAKSQFYFMPIDRNVIIHSQIDDNNDNYDDITLDIRYRLSVQEYLAINGISCQSQCSTRSEGYSQDFFTLFTQGHFSDRDFEIIEQLRAIRDKSISICAIDGLEQFLSYIDFQPTSTSELSDKEVQYLTGGWFEEYVYYMVGRMVSPSDIAMGLLIQRQGSRSVNELDVVFTYDNRLFVVECKTGVGRRAQFNEIVYKACALREALLGLRSHAYIFSLNDDYKDHLRHAARNMNIMFCDGGYAKSPSKFKNLILNSKLYI